MLLTKFLAICVSKPDEIESIFIVSHQILAQTNSISKPPKNLMA